jgi:hypothetical protein
MAETINGIVEHRSDTESAYITNSTVPYAGELCFATDTKVLKVGDGTSTWAELPVITNEYRKYKNGSQFIPSFTGQAVTIEQSEPPNPVIFAETIDTTSVFSNGPEATCGGVWAEDDIAMGDVGLVQISGIARVKVAPTVRCGDLLSVGVLYPVPTAAYFGLSITGAPSGADGLTISTSLDPADDVYVPILSTYSQQDVFDTLAAVTLTGYSTIPIQGNWWVIWMATASEQKLYQETTPTDGSGWYASCPVKSAGMNATGSQLVVGSIELVEATCPANGTISLTLPGETTPITRVCTTGDARVDVYDDLIDDCPATYIMIQRDTLLYFNSISYMDESDHVDLDVGTTTWNEGAEHGYQEGIIALPWGYNTADIQSRVMGLCITVPDTNGYADVQLRLNSNVTSTIPIVIDSDTSISITPWMGPYLVAGTAEITTIVSSCTRMAIFLPVDAWTLATGGNIGAASQAIVGKPMILIQDTRNYPGTWWPSY